MNRALYAAASGMAAQQRSLDIIANNLANADVTAFKGVQATFTDMSAGGTGGLGTAQMGEHVVFEPGKLVKTGGPFDLAIDGPGFFIVTDAHGRRGYTRDGAFSRAADGTLRNESGWTLSGVRIPADAISADVAPDGTVTVKASHAQHRIGKLHLAEFAAPEYLRALGGALFAATPQSGAARSVQAGDADGPKIRFGMLEQSNVSIVEAMMEILTAQRAYEANAKGVQAADEMLRICASRTT